jgi:hypothetical protein
LPRLTGMVWAWWALWFQELLRPHSTTLKPYNKLKTFTSVWTKSFHLKTSVRWPTTFSACRLMSPIWLMVISLRGQPRARGARHRLLAHNHSHRCFTVLQMKIKNSCSEGSSIRDPQSMIGLVLFSI